MIIHVQCTLYSALRSSEKPGGWGKGKRGLSEPAAATQVAEAALKMIARQFKVKLQLNSGEVERTQKTMPTWTILKRYDLSVVESGFESILQFILQMGLAISFLYSIDMAVYVNEDSINKPIIQWVNETMSFSNVDIEDPTGNLFLSGLVSILSMTIGQTL